MKKTLIVHAGLHKTGSTAVQVALGKYREVFGDRGVLLHSPDGVRIAHHQHASAIAHGNRFVRKKAAFDRLAEDATAFRGHTIFVSSEDFESALGDPEALGRLKAFCERAGLQPLLLVYLRNPIDYFESLFFEMLKHGQPLCADELAEAVLKQGNYTWGTWSFHFDHAAMWHVIRDAGLDIRFRDYHALSGGSTVSDILEVLGASDLAVQSSPETRANPRKANRNLMRFVINRQGEGVPTKKWLRSIEAQILKAPPRLSSDMRARFQERFRKSTRELDDAHGFGLTEAMLAPAPPGPSTRLEAVFSAAIADRVMRLWQDSPTSRHEAECEELAQLLLERCEPA